MVSDVDAAIAFYTGHLRFTVLTHPAPAFAVLERGELKLVLSSPGPIQVLIRRPIVSSYWQPLQTSS